MSYKYQSKERIEVEYSGSKTVHYPASEHGGSMTVVYSGTTYEDVFVNILVDTDEFDNRVDDCRGTVDLLTGAVVATETAQVASVRANSRKVADTIIDGFFQLTKSEITQQITELTAQLNSQLINLRTLAQRCHDKQKQMQTDYQRIASRYHKVFTDLNNELENRIFELDKPTFLFRQKIDEHSGRTNKNDMVSSSLVSIRENERLNAQISVSNSKSSALEALRKANRFLAQSKAVQATLDESILDEKGSGTIYSPVCYIETSSNKGTERQVYNSMIVGQSNDNRELELMQNLNWQPISSEHNENVMKYVQRNIAETFAMGDKHQQRVRETLEKICRNQSIESI